MRMRRTNTSQERSGQVRTEQVDPYFIGMIHSLRAITGKAEEARIRQCLWAASAQYEVPYALALAIRQTEDGIQGVVNRNRNGSYDIGPMQINSTWLPVLRRYGIGTRELIDNGCVNAVAGVWILARSLQSGGFLGRQGLDAAMHNPEGFWRKVGNYNSRIPRYNSKYRQKVYRHLLKPFP